MAHYFIPEPWLMFNTLGQCRYFYPESWIPECKLLQLVAKLRLKHPDDEYHLRKIYTNQLLPPRVRVHHLLAGVNIWANTYC